MTNDFEQIDSRQMEIISEIPVEYGNDEEITKPENAEKSKLYVGSLDEDLIIAYLSRKTERVISEVVFEKKNGLSVGKSINELLSREEPWNESIRFEKGKDKILVTYSNSWGHGLAAPLERVNLYNRRTYELDGLRAQDIWLSLPPGTAKKLADEIEKQFS